jgi:TonB family protein
MQKSMTYRIIRNGFWLSLLLHFLLFLSICTVVTLQPEEETPHKSPHYFVPSYMYTGSIKPTVQQHNSTGTQSNPLPDNASLAQNTENTPPSRSKAETETDQGAVNMANAASTQGTLQVQKKQKSLTAERKKPVYQKSMLAASMNMLKQDQLNEVTKTRSEDPVYLVGDDNEPADPLIKLLGRSLSAHFRYPRMAGEFGIRGKVIIELTLHPEGYFTDVQMLRSSTNADLDAAALYAVNSAPSVIGANRFISQPKHFVVGFVFY